MSDINIKKPDDWHLHLRDGAMLANVVAHSAKRFARALVMPNLEPPILTVREALDYRDRILQALAASDKFTPYMTLYLTEETNISEVELAGETPEILAYKLYPAGATTNSDSGVKSVDKIMPILESMAENNLVLCVHGEVTDPDIDIFDREKIFIDHVLSKIIYEIPELKVVLEHISTKEGVEFVKSANSNLAGTITAHHLLENRNAMFTGGIKPHHYCLPILKRDTHQKEIIKAATSGNSKFFAGTDSAPHQKTHKETACGCAGIYTAHAAVELYAEVFANYMALKNLEKFASINGALFYGLEPNNLEITLKRHKRQVPESYFAQAVVPYKSGETINWTLSSNADSDIKA